VTPTVAGDWHTYTVREPVGVVGIIVPWNFPLNIAVTHMSAALAAGCTVVLKPAEQTPLSAIRLCELAEEAGFPAGVINLVTGFGSTAGAALAAHPGVDKIAFTGSTQTGRAIVSAGLANMKRVTLELGGKSPSIVFADADLDGAIPGIAAGIFYNAGQVCAAGSRLYVHKDVFDRVIEGVVAYAEALRVGQPLEQDTQTGPLISAAQRDRVLGYIESGRREGAALASGGGAVGKRGYFVAPTVLVDVASSMRVMREEIFGPVLCATRFGDGDFDAIMAEANNSPYGLIAAVWTRDLGTAHRAARELKAGVVRINSMARHLSLPFGGVKQSGWGRENGRSGVEAYTELKSVSIAL
jgi:phenylacetaldehyde dehydrogenase